MKANDVRKGTVLLHNGAPHRVMDFTHVTPGKGQAVVQTKLRNLMTGSQTEVRYGSTEAVSVAEVYAFKATYLYADGDLYHFMNNQDYEQITLTGELLGNDVHFLQEQMEVEITTFEELPLGIKLPQTVILTVVETEPEMKGATASNSPKPATTDTGHTLSVPAFVKQGDRLIVNTETGEYLSRAD
ncbi:MAG: elongation factor P [Bdellovibrionales bacterium]|nr:elongation factor P [Bdellovibrionales bacterium]